MRIEGKIIRNRIAQDPTTIAQRENEIIEYGLPDCSQLRQFEGIKVICKVDRLYCSYAPASTSYLTSCTDAPSPNEKFTLQIWHEDWTYLDGRCVVIQGTLSMFADKPYLSFEPDYADVSFCDL